jgi:TolB-like protein/tRNA A-37 threonylcarbamoyl transferase component Bud32
LATQCPKCSADNPDTVKFCGECGSSLIPAKGLSVTQTKTLEIPSLELTPGSIFAGRYQIIEELGKGGMGKVYRAVDTTLHEEVAIKLIRPDISADKKTLARFHNELKLARKIAHRNVGKMYELMENKGLHFITMEYVPGEDLGSFIKRARQLTPRTAILMAEDICEGLVEAHRMGVIHRDLKPSNIIIDREGNARIMDFGIARSMESTDASSAGVMVGTLQYMSPEQAQGLEADQRSDIYSLGVMFYEMVTGRLPFGGETPWDIARQHVNAVPRDPRTINHQIPVALSRLILRCLEKEKSRRFQSASEVLAELRRIEGGIMAEEKGAEKRGPLLQPLLQVIKERKIVETVAGFVGGGWLFLEVVHWILIDHYHFPERTLDIALVSLVGALAIILIWRLSGGPQKRVVGAKRLVTPASIVIVLAVTGTIVWRIAVKRATPLPPPAQHSIAVLPFIDLSPQQDQEWLALGIADTLINSLGRVKGLRVPALTSSISFKGKQVDIREIGQKLNVENVLDGSLKVSGDDLRISVELISVKDGFQLWSNRYEKKRRDEFAVEDEIALEVIKVLELELLGGEEAQVTAKYTDNLEAYNLYLRGRFCWEGRTKESLLESVDFFKRSLLQDPKYALAYAGLADAYWVLGDNGYIPESESFPKAKEAALRALGLDKNIPDAHAAMGAILGSYEWNWPGAKKELELAINLSPGNAQVRHRYAFLLTYLGRHDDAIREVRFARDLDPLAPRIAANVGGLLFYARRYEEALLELKKVMSQFPDHLAVYHYASDVCAAMGLYEEALGYCRKLKEIGGYEPEWLKARIYAKWGKRKEAEDSIKGMESQSKEFNIGPTLFAEIYSLLGENDRAFLLLDRAYARRESYLCYLKVDPWFYPLRPDPKFKGLLKKMKLD